MSINRIILLSISLLLLVGSVVAMPAQRHSAASPFRADVERYLIFLNDELAELDFQVQHGEITRPYYRRANDRLNILKSLVTNYGRSTNPAPLPEYHVILLDEIDSLIPNGSTRLRQARAPQVIDSKWRFLRKIARSEVFYILERIDDSSGAPDRDISRSAQQ